MKIDRRNPRHLLVLALSLLAVALATVLRWIVPPGAAPKVILYGHKFTGNLLAIHRQASADGAIGFDFLTMDRRYARALAGQGLPGRFLLSPRGFWAMVRANAIISDHGLHALELLMWSPRLRTIDVWHGIPFKGFDAGDFRVQRRYDEIWVASPLLARLYVERFGFEPARVRVTGYARTDTLARRDAPDPELRQRIGLDRFPGARVVLFAPTWQQDDKQRSLLPFGMGGDHFVSEMEALCQRTGSVLLLRAHLNSGDAGLRAGSRVLPVPFAEYPDTERVLSLSDVLVCDWSSIAFDFLVLQRPTLFLDVPAPFRKGFSLGPEYRFGPIIRDQAGLLAALAQCLEDPAGFQQPWAERYRQALAEVYGGFADGHAAERCLERLRALVATGGSSR